MLSDGNVVAATFCSWISCRRSAASVEGIDAKSAWLAEYASSPGS